MLRLRQARSTGLASCMDTVFHCTRRQNPEKNVLQNQHTMARHAHSSQGKFDEGFTRIYIGRMLVVIAIIAILAALLLSAVGQVKSRVQAVCCLNNLQHWGNATHLYALDNDGFLPPDGWANPHSTPNRKDETNSWYVLLPKAIGLPSYFEMPWRSNSTIDLGHSIWICPSNTRRSNGTELFHYCLNECVDGTGATNIG